MLRIMLLLLVVWISGCSAGVEPVNDCALQPRQAVAAPQWAVYWCTDSQPADESACVPSPYEAPVGDRIVWVCDRPGAGSVAGLTATYASVSFSNVDEKAAIDGDSFALVSKVGVIYSVTDNRIMLPSAGSYLVSVSGSFGHISESDSPDMWVMLRSSSGNRLDLRGTRAGSNNQRTSNMAASAVFVVGAGEYLELVSNTNSLALCSGNIVIEKL